MPRIINNRYILQSRLGAGGMGEVFRATDAHTHETVAVKMLFVENQDEAKLLRNVTHEARAVARLHHTGIVKLVDYGRSDEEKRPFIVMEYVPGGGLGAWEDVLSVRDLLGVTDRILAALAYAHAHGVIHRDLKPENILVVEDDKGMLHPKLVDFGIAQLSEAEIHSDKRIMGTPFYMAPEQARGKSRYIAPSTDLYALGVILYEMVSGHLPFQSESLVQLLFKKIHEKPIPLVPLPGIDLPDGLDTLIMRLLASTPDDRFLFAADVRRALRRLDWNQASTLPVGEAGKRVGSQETLSAEAKELSIDTGGALPPAREVELEDDGLQRTLITQPVGMDTLNPAELPNTGPTAPSLLGLTEPPFVGREREREQLWQSFLDTLEESSVRVVVVHGPSGVGKSRLVRWLTEQASEQGLAWTVSVGGGSEAEVPAGGLDVLLERHLKLQGLNRAECAPILNEELVARGTIEATELDPLLDFLRPQEASRNAALGQVAAIEAVGVIARILRVAAARRPLLLWIDDLQGPQAKPLIDLVDFLLASRAFCPMPILPIITLSFPEAEPRVSAEVHALKTLREFAREDAVTWIELGPLDDDAIAQLATSILPLHINTILLLQGMVEGNPRHVRQLLNHWEQEQHLVRKKDGHYALRDRRDSSLPSTFQELWRSQLGKVVLAFEQPRALHGIVAHAAICGRSFAMELLQQAMEDESRDDILPWLDAGWDALIANGLWVELAQGEATFASPELHNYALEQLVNEAQSISLHALFARLKTAYYAEQGAARFAEIAHHYHRAGLREEACEHFLLAARHATDTSNYGEAEALLEEARSIVEAGSVPRAGELADRIDLGLALASLRTANYTEALQHLASMTQRARPGVRDHLAAEAVHLRGLVALRRGDLEEARTAFDGARSRFESLGDPRTEGLALHGLAEVHLLRTHYAEAALALEQSARLLGVLNHTLDIAAQRMLEGRIAAAQHTFDDAERCFDEARRLYEEAGLKHFAAEALLFKSDGLIQTARLDEALKCLEAAMLIFIDVGDPARVATTHRGLGQLYRKLGDYDAAEKASQTNLMLAKRVGDALELARALNGLGEAARKKHNWTRAREHYQAYLEAAAALGDELSLAIGKANLGLVNNQLALWDEAADNFKEAVVHLRKLDNKPFLIAFLGCFAHACAEVERFDEARDAITEALTLDADIELKMGEYLTALQDFAEAAEDELPELSQRARQVVEQRRSPALESS